MEDRIARLKSSKDARTFALNARRLGRFDLESLALERAIELQAMEEGFSTPAQQAIGAALYAYEQQQSQIKGRVFRANRTRQMFARHGTLDAAERMVLNRGPSKGYEVLDEAGLQELSFEAIIDRFPEEFSAEALEASRARLEGRPRNVGISKSIPLARDEDVSGVAAPSEAVLDAEALNFVEGFLDPTGWFLARWLPRYRESIHTIENALALDSPEKVFELIWKTAENHISNAGRGLLRFELVDSMRNELIQVMRDIKADGSPEAFARIIERFQRWYEEKRIPMVPRLLIARAFAGMHPRNYHTTVDSDSQNEVLPWFVRHTGFSVPNSANWAERAEALTRHLDRIGTFAGDELARNIFPWFVVEQIRARTSWAETRPHHSPRLSSAFSDLPPARRFIELRHNAVQTLLFTRLVEEYGEACVWTEYPTGTGGFADAVVRLRGGGHLLYEIKIAPTAAAVVREALGQLLEYSYRGGGLESNKLFVVGEPTLDEATRIYLDRLSSDFNLDIDYLQVVLPVDEVA